MESFIWISYYSKAFINQLTNQTTEHKNLDLLRVNGESKKPILGIKIPEIDYPDFSKDYSCLSLQREKKWGA